MKTLFVAGVVAVAAAVFGGWQLRTARETDQERQALEAEIAALKRASAGLEAKLAAESTRTTAVTADNTKLAEALRQAQAARKKRATPVPLPSREAMEARAKEAIARARDSSDDEAMTRELLACYDGLRLPDVRSGAFSGVVRALVEIGERRPAALVALEERLEAARRRLLGEGEDMAPLSEFAQVSRAMKKEGAVLALFDAVPPGDVRRKNFAIYAVEDLRLAQRYQDALLGTRYPSMSAILESDALRGESGQRYLVTSTAKNVEILAGGGDLAHARALAERLLVRVPGTETQDALQTHLTRAGQPDLLKTPAK